ncbi:MAG: ArnT family glycosyltransferase [Microgenomates group bacterium]
MRRIINILAKNRLLIITLIFGIFLRFYKLNGFVTFLGDQGRDAIILKRMITLEHLPAIGAPTSIGQVYLGPFYYYFIAPWLLFFKFNPVGPAFGVALFSSFYLLINYLIVRELFDKKTALVSTIFLTFSSTLIELSRFSWNPNLLPLFTLLTIYFLIKSLKTNRWYFFALTGAFLSFVIQLHYLALFLIPAVTIIYISYLIKNLKNIKKITFNFSLLTFNFLFFSSPLVIFDLRHQFLNTKNFIKLFQQSGSNLTTKINNFLDSFYFLNFYSFHINLNKLLIYILLLFLIVSYITLLKQKTNINYFLLFFLTTIFFLSFYSGQKHPHYFGVLYPLYYIIVSYFLTFTFDSLLGKILTILFIFGLIFLNFQKYPYFKNPPNNQIQFAEKIAKKIYKNISKKKFTVTALPEKYSDSTYRYFLELWKKRPIEKDSLEKADELFVVCEKECSTIIGNPQWDIAYFAPNKIIGEWKVDNVKIYKLVR